MHLPPPPLILLTCSSCFYCSHILPLIHLVRLAGNDTETSGRWNWSDLTATAGIFWHLQNAWGGSYPALTAVPERLWFNVKKKKKNHHFSIPCENGPYLQGQAVPKQNSVKQRPLLSTLRTNTRNTEIFNITTSSGIV